jgi:hypothetical protein
LAAASVAALVVCVEAEAAWDVVPVVSAAMEADSNPRLDEDALANSDMRTVLDARLRTVSFSERSEFIFEPQLQASQYSDESNSDLDSTDLFFTTRGRYSWEKTDFRYYADFSQQSILNAELQSAEVTDPDAPVVPGGDTGRLLFLNQDVDRTFLQPALSFRITDLTQIEVATQFAKTSYSGPTLALRSDFTDKSFSIGFQRRANEINTISVRMYTSDYEADTTNNRTDTTGIIGTFSRPVTETLTFNLDLGVLRSDFTFAPGTGPVVSRAETNPRININLRQRSERTTLNFDIGRQVEPGGSGFVVTRDLLHLSATRDLKPRLKGTVALLGMNTKSVGDVVSSADRDYTRAEVNLDWAMKQRLFLSVGYAYTYQKFVLDTSSVDANTFYVGISYEGLSRR